MVARRSVPVVLFADRDLSWSRRARGELRRKGVRVLMAGSVDDAFHQAAVSPPDLLFLDDGVEGRGDRDLGTLFHEALPRTRIVLLQSEPGPVCAGLFAAVLRPATSELVLDLARAALVDGLADESKPRPGTVLCVDDDKEFLRSVARLLSRRGYRVSAFEDAGRALEALAWVKPDVALVDIMMPGMDGLDLAERIRETSGGRIPVVLLTALDTDEAFYEGHQRGASYMVEKTAAPQKVLDVVDYLAGGLDPREREEIKSRL